MPTNSRSVQPDELLPQEKDLKKLFTALRRNALIGEGMLAYTRHIREGKTIAMAVDYTLQDLEIDADYLYGA